MAPAIAQVEAIKALGVIVGERFRLNDEGLAAARKYLKSKKLI